MNRFILVSSSSFAVYYRGGLAAVILYLQQIVIRLLVLIRGIKQQQM